MRSTLSTFLLLFALCLTLFGCQDRGAGAAEPDGPPNILFAIADDASYPHMGAYGTDWINSPAFDRVAREGILFTRAYTPNAKCAPSRSCILTGRNSWQLEEAANHWPYFPAKFATYPEVLDASGYHVGYTGKGWAPGRAFDADGRPRQLAGTPYQEHQTEPPARYISNNDYAANFEAFLDARPEGEPFCFWYGSSEPHRAYEYGVGKRLGGKSIDQIDRVPAFWPDNDTVRMDMLDYAYEIEYFDQHLQRMLDLLEARGELDNTLVVVTADNGMPFPRIKGQAYEWSNHLPLAIMWPAGIRNPGRRVDDYVSFIDFAPTFLELARITDVAERMAPITGQSLRGIFSSEASGQVEPERDHVLIGKERHDVGRPDDAGYPIRGIVKDNQLLLMNFEPDRWPAGNPETGYLNTDGSPTKTQVLQARDLPATRSFWALNFGKRPPLEYYRLDLDPNCMLNQAGNPEYAAVQTALQNELIEALREQEDPRVLGQGYVFDAYVYADSTTRDFYNRYTGGETLRAGWVNPSDFQEIE